MENEKEKNRILFEEMPIKDAVLAMAVPTVISQLIVLVYNLADTFFIGSTNDPYKVAGVSLILPIFNLCIAFSNLAGTGGGTLIARLMGRGETEEARKTASFSFLFSLISGLAFAILTLIFMDPLLRLLGASDDTFLYAKQYTSCVIVAGAAPTIVSMCLGNLLRNVGCSKQAGFGVSMGGLVNIALDPLFMFVILPKGNEALGAGIATAISNWLVFLYFLGTIRRLNSEILNFSPKTGLPSRENIRSFFAVGFTAALGPFLFDLDYIVIDRLMSGYSDMALAAIGIVLKAERFPLNVGIGLSIGIIPLMAYNYSAGNLKRMRDVLVFTRRLGTIVGIVSILAYELFSFYIVRIFIKEEVTLALGTDFLRIRALATIFMFLSFIYVHFFQAVGKGGFALFLVVFRWAIINIPMLFILNALFGMYGVVWAQFASDLIVAAVSYFTYRRFIRALGLDRLQK